MEIEAKFSIDDDRLWRKYRGCPRIGAYGLGAAREYSIMDDYLDTKEQAIRRAGHNLRVRSHGGERRVTIKSAQSAPMRFSVREEIEFPLHGDAEDVSNWVNREAAALIVPLLRGNALRPCVKLRQQRTERPVLRGEDTVAMMGLDAVQVWHAGALLDDFRVLEFELARAADMNVLDEISAVLAKDGLIPRPVAKLNRALAVVELARKRACDVA